MHIVKMLKKIIAWGVISLSLCSYAFAYDGNIKLAIFDNPRIDPNNTWVSQELQDSYVAGIKTAISVAKSEGVNIDYKAFFYGDNLLDIIQNVPNVKTWDPDVIVGVHNSNQFLMSKNYFSNRLVLSIFASDPSLFQLPSNFYSLGVPDQYMATAIVDFLNKYYPNSNIFLAVETDSKESVDMSGLLSTIYQQKYPQKQIVQSEFLSDDLNSLDMPTFLAQYKPNDVIVVLTMTYYTQVNLMDKITQYLQPARPVFVSDVDNWGDSNIPAGQDTPYDAYRLTPSLVNPNNPEYQVFAKAFTVLNGSAPRDTVSYATYQAVMSVVTALKDFPPPAEMSPEDAVLYSYGKALQKDPNWFRASQFSVYKMHPPKETYFGTIK